jgi:protein CWC15
MQVRQAEEEAKMKEAELMRGNPLININNPTLSQKSK